MTSLSERERNFRGNDSENSSESNVTPLYQQQTGICCAKLIRCVSSGLHFSHVSISRQACVVQSWYDVSSVLHFSHVSISRQACVVPSWYDVSSVLYFSHVSISRQACVVLSWLHFSHVYISKQACAAFSWYDLCHQCYIVSTCLSADGHVCAKLIRCIIRVTF
jgi:hypothetical protein